MAGLVSQVQLSFAETGFGTAYSQFFNAGDGISLVQNYGGYTLIISGDSDNLYGISDLGDNPFLSLTVQVSNVGSTPPANPVRIGMSITGLDSLPSGAITFDSSFTGIFHTASSANFHTYYDPTNTLFGRTADLSRFDGLSAQSNSNDQSLIEQVNSPFSATIFLTVTPSPSAHPTLDGQLTMSDAPEPASIGLLGAGMTGLGLIRRKASRIR